MNDGVAMLIERMKTNPEEFVAEPLYGATKWGMLLQEYRPFLDKEDLEVFDAIHKTTVVEHMKQRFTEKVIEELIDPKKLTTEDVLRQYRDNRLTTVGTNTITSNSLTIGNTILTEEKIKQILKNQNATPIAGVTQTL